MQPEALRSLTPNINPEIAGVFSCVLLRPTSNHYRRLTDPSIRALLYHDSSDYRVALLISNGRIDANQCGDNKGNSTDDSYGNGRLMHVLTKTLGIVPLNPRIFRCGWRVVAARSAGCRSLRF